jgi:cysteinyl-tRNA synthetase
LKKELHPLAPALKAANDVKFLVEKRFENLKDLQAQFDEEILRLAALSSQDELEAEKVYHQQKSESASRTIEASRHLVGKLEERNGILRAQNELLSEKVSVLEKLLESERATRKRLEDELVLTEKIKALGALLEPEEVSLSSLYDKYKDDFRARKSASGLVSSGTIEKAPGTKE